jgi:D-alanyl-D-alanine carboxypeptidase (penicillin-binding protein 5/6)
MPESAGRRRSQVTVVALVTVMVLSMAAPAVAAPIQIPVGPGVVGEPPEVTAATYLLYDESLDMVLVSDGMDIERPMASTTKVMTALLVLENTDPDDIVTVTADAAIRRGSIIPLYAGEQLTVRQLLLALLVRSGNDAARALAAHVSGDVPTFVTLMNERARELGMTHTSFRNPNGLDVDGHYSSARDLLIVDRAAMEHPLYREIIATKGAVLPEDPYGHVRFLRQTNSLVREDFEGALGGKTGDTPNADKTFVGAAERDGRRLYVVVMGSDDHMADAAALFEHGFKDYPVFAAIAAGGRYAVHRAGDTETGVSAAGDLTTVGVDGADVTVAPSIEDGEPVLVASAGEQVLGSVSVDTEPAPPLPGLGDAVGWLAGLFDR